MFNFSAEMMRAMLSWRVILDILLIAVALFLAYRTLRRLGTWKIVAGIFIAIAIFDVAYFLDLRGIKWIYSNLSHVALIGSIVIFQPEIRKVLERAASLRRGEIGSQGADLSMQISEAVFSLAQQRRGAILVLPGKEPIKEGLYGGYTLDAEPSHPLIMSIFDPHSPGHDGALIIESGKVSHFGVRLPLSKTEKLPKEYGTRHHAAMGLSELSDALVIVVSEERGAVTAFYDGKMERVHDKNTVSTKIVSHWQNTATYVLRGERKWGLLSGVALSLFVAFIFWSTVIISQGELIERVFSVPIEYTATPENIALVGDKPTEIKLHLAGPKSELDGTKVGQLTAKIDLSHAKAGKQAFAVTEENVRLPRGVKLLDAVPSNLALSLKEVLEREVNVKPQLVGNLPEGFQIASVLVKPHKVRVFSPADQGEDVEINVTTTPIYLESMRETTRLYCKIIAPANVQSADKRWPDVEVLVVVSRGQ
jgi:uncharacterized protein (TIGR00159 family)